MKKTFLAMLLAGGTMTMFAQNTQTGNQPDPSTSSPNTTQQSAGVTGDPNSTTQNNVSNMNNSAANQTTNNGTMNNGGTINTWNGVSTNSTSWTPDRDPSWGWNSYGVWNGSANWNANSNNPNAGVNGSVSMNNGTGTLNSQGSMNTDASMSSAGSYSAYGTEIPYLPANVQTRFSQDYPTGANNQYKWNQYGDWYHTHYMNNGRLTQYFYDQRGSGYSLALPVLQTYVPENIVASALNKYGSNLYSISMVKTNTGNDTYVVGLLDRGQISMHYLDESGVTVSDVWRTEDYGTMQSTQSNAAMDGQQGTINNQGDQQWNQNNQQNMNHQDGNKDMNRANDGTMQSTEGVPNTTVNPGTVNNAADTQMPDQSGTNDTQTSDMGSQPADTQPASETKTSETKKKDKEGKSKNKTKRSTDNQQNQ